MKIKVQLLLFVLIVFPGACTVKPTSPPSLVAPTSYTIATKLPATVMPTPSLLPTSIPTAPLVTRLDIENIKWATYKFSAGVTFEYPSEWIIISQDVNWVWFSGYGENVRVNVYDRPAERKAVANPHTWGTNEGGYEVLWEKPISIENAAGLEFIWGQPSNDQIAGYLYAIYYSEQHELDVRLSTDSDTITIDSDTFRAFEHMVQSVRITQ